MIFSTPVISLMSSKPTLYYGPSLGSVTIKIHQTEGEETGTSIEKHCMRHVSKMPQTSTGKQNNKLKT